MFGRLRKLFGSKSGKRGYSDLMSSRLISDWLLSTDDPNLRLTQHLGNLRKMARDMAETNHYAISYLNLRVTNVVGPSGFKLQSRVSNREGTPDDYARGVIEREWQSWKEVGNCTVSGDVHYHDESRMNERTLATDGEVFIWIYPGYKNEHRFAIRSFEPDYIDHEYNIGPGKLPNSPNSVVMGKEIDPRGRCVAYWVDGAHPGALHWHSEGKKRSRIPALSEYLADENAGKMPARSGYILHQFEQKRADQRRGIPDLAAVTTPLRQLERTEEAHSVAARLSSCAVFQQIDSNSDVDDLDGTSPGENGMDVSPGFIARNGMGRKWEVLQPAFPNASLPDHGKYTLKGAGQALGVTYPTFSGDLEGTSYSSGRTGALAERDQWKIKQDHSINCRERPIFNAWLRTQLLFNDFGNLRPSQERRYRVAHIQGRRWDWVDPLKDSKGKQNDLAMRITTPQRVIIEAGGDPDDIIAEWAEYEAKIAAAGLQPTNFGDKAPPLSNQDEEEDTPTTTKQGDE